MKRAGVFIAVAGFVSTSCVAQEPIKLTEPCPQFPPKDIEQNGGVVASTSFGATTPQAPPMRHVNIPAGSIDGVEIVLERNGCFGTCPEYRVSIRGNGDVFFHGEGFVTFAGDHRTRIPPQVVQCLLNNFRSIDFWSLDSEYAAAVTDLPTYRTSLTIGGETKVLTDYAGQLAGMPPGVTALEQAIDQAASTKTWLIGDDQTVAALEAEGFDFHSKAAAGLLAEAAKAAPDSVVFALLDRGAPLDGVARDAGWSPRMSAVEAAAMYGRLELLRRLISAGAFLKGGKPLVSSTLRASVASQKAAVVAEVLKYGPDVNSRDKNGDTALALVFTGPHPHAGDENSPDEDAAIIRMLGAAGANPNLRNSGRESLLALAYSQEDKDALIAIGARSER